MNSAQLVRATAVLLLATALAACSGKAPQSEEPHEDAAGQKHDNEGAHQDEHGESHGVEEGVVDHHDDHGGEGGKADQQDGHSADEGEGHHDEHVEEGGANFARIDPSAASGHGIEVAQAARGVVAESISLTGRLIIDPRRVALVRARFAGPVRSVAKEVGDSVQKGDVLASIESNDSMTVYDVRSPLSGVVLERMTNAGDVAGTDPLFRIGDLSSLQAELKVFQGDQSRVQRGADALVRVGDQEVTGKVVNVVPEIDSRTQAMLVRVDLKPKGPISAAPGRFVTGQITLGEGDAAVVVAAKAVQRLEGREVIFVPEAEGFRVREVTLGRRSNDQIEVIAGLEVGESYVSAGAFLIKAEIGKGSAEHDH